MGNKLVPYITVNSVFILKNINLFEMLFLEMAQ